MRREGLEKLTNLTSLFKWLVEERLGEIARRQTLLTDTRDRKLCKTIIVHILKGHDTYRSSSVISSIHVKWTKISYSYFGRWLKLTSFRLEATNRYNFISFCMHLFIITNPLLQVLTATVKHYQEIPVCISLTTDKQNQTSKMTTTTITCYKNITKPSY